MAYAGLALTFILVCAEAVLGYAVVKSKKPNALLPYILLLGMALRIIPSLDVTLHQWDECYHALVGKNLAKHFFTPLLYPEAPLPYDYKNWTSNYIWLHKPPLALWAIALSVKAFGYHAFAVRIPSVIFSTLSIYLTYLIGSQITTKRNAVFAAFLFSINGFLIDLCSGRVATDHVDTLFIFLVACGLYLSISDGASSQGRYKRTNWIGVLAGLAVLTKWAPGFFIVLMYGLVLLLYRRHTPFQMLRKILLCATVSVLICMPWNIYACQHFRQEYLYEQLYSWAHISTSLEGHNKPFWFFIDQARIHWNELIYVHVALFIYQFIQRENPRHAILLLWIAIPFLLFSLASTKMPAYVAICAPAIYLLVSMSIFNIHHARIKFWLAIMTLVLGVRYSMERIKPFDRFQKQHTPAEWVKTLNTHPKPVVVFGLAEPVQAMFFYEVIAYTNYPSKETLLSLHTRGAQVIAVDTPELPDYMRNDSTVVKIRP